MNFYRIDSSKNYSSRLKKELEDTLNGVTVLLYINDISIRQTLHENLVDLIIADIHSLSVSARTFLATVQDEFPATSVFFTSSSYQLNIALELIDQGAADRKLLAALKLEKELMTAFEATKAYDKLQADLENAAGCGVTIGNDANCFALIEALHGAGKGFGVVLGVILGTGMGGGVVYQGRVWPGAQGLAGEWGHSTIDPHGALCYCGRRGCQEQYISGTGIRRMYRERTGREKSAPEIHDHAKDGADPVDTPVTQVDEFLVNTAISGTQQDPQVTSLQDGGFVTVWADNSGADNAEPGSGNDVYGQRYDAAGDPVGSEFLVNSYSGGTQYQPSIAAHGDGFVVTWQDNDGSADSREGSGHDIFAKTFTTDNVTTPVVDVDEFLVNASGDGETRNSNNTVIDSTSGQQENPSVTELDDGGFVVTWTSHSTSSSVDGGSSYGVFGQRYDANGAAEGAEFRINTSMDTHMAHPEVTAIDGGFAVAWYYWNGDIYGQAFSTASSGTPQKIGDEFELDPGETRQVKVRVTPPNEMIAEDDYTFTITVQPKGLPVAGQPVDLTVKSTLGISAISEEMQEVLAIAVIVVGSLLVLYLFARSRSENRLIVESLNDEYDD